MASKYSGFELAKRAQDKLTARRDAAAYPPADAGSGRTRPNINWLGESLLAMSADDLMPTNSNDTFAVGLYEGTQLIVAAKGVSNSDFFAGNIAARLGGLLGRTVIPEPTTGIDSGLHSEMAIVRHVLAKMGGVAKEAAFNLRYTLQIICLGKGVCPDCAGYLNKYGVPHFSLQRESKFSKTVIKSTECGKPSAGGLWTHPRTTATFQSNTNKKDGATIQGWQKNGESAKLY